MIDDGTRMDVTDWQARKERARAFLRDNKPKPGHAWSENLYEYKEENASSNAPTARWAGRE